MHTRIRFWLLILPIFMEFSSPNVGWAQHYGWMKVADPTDHPATAIEFADSLNGWMGVINENADRAIMKTSDGGHTWRPQRAPLALNVRSISFADAMQGWVAGDLGNADGYIIHTTNGGQTWREQLRISRHFYVSVDAQSESRVTTVGRLDSFLVRTGLIGQTVDGGSQWEDRRFLTRIEKITFVDSLHGWAIAREGDTNSGRIIHTNDGGQSWVIQPYDVNEVSILSGLSFSDSLHGWAVSVLDYPWVIHTANGGTTWEKLYQFPRNTRGTGLYDICFTDTLNGWAFGTASFEGFRPVIYRTTDGGLSWDLEFVDLEIYDLFGVVDGIALDRQHAWALAYVGAVYRYGLLTEVGNTNPGPPLSFSLSQNYPNPFNASTAITYTLPEPAWVELYIHDLLGRIIKTMVQGRQLPGCHKIHLDGDGLANGLYHYTLKTHDFQATKTMLFIK